MHKAIMTRTMWNTRVALAGDARITLGGPIPGLAAGEEGGGAGVVADDDGLCDG